MQPLSSRDATARVAELDLSPIKFKLQKEYGWTGAFVEQTEMEYRQFLILNAIYPEQAIVPTKAVDSFWHQHILDTRKYAVDCEKVFGEFLHHFPYFGLRGDEDAANLSRAFEATRVLSQKEFGGSAIIHLAATEATSCSDCAGGVSDEVDELLEIGLAGCSDCAGGISLEAGSLGDLAGCSDCSGGLKQDELRQPSFALPA